MIFVIDSGSTKSDWLLVEKDGKYVDSYKTMGFNPFFHSSGFIAAELAKHDNLMAIADKITSIYYYGAGCSSEHFKNIVKQGLHEHFKHAEIHVDHDLLAAAYATFDGSPALSAILGTGSNACYFNGTEFRTLNAGLGYILGDEGSGSYFGKKLLASYLYGQLPEPLAAELQAEFKLNRSEIFHHVYELPHANVYLASFTRFIAKHLDDAFIQKMLVDGMREFFRIHVLSFPGYEKLKVHFVGSIAFYFSDAIYQAAEELGIQVGQIVKSPIQNLLQYHVNNVFVHA
ncbi:MAG: hypothetical protein LPK45_00350 [Bacteroidota bacterium]|nr:hypothetical protein [Bacteroidota bacterium]MDX5429473.1 hypothetical protein [Bacteroidota bacterium]MDX5468262.1 hypothetical protein [Bacteroidota bacterium]